MTKGLEHLLIAPPYILGSAEYVGHEANNDNGALKTTMMLMMMIGVTFLGYKNLQIPSKLQKLLSELIIIPKEMRMTWPMKIAMIECNDDVDMRGLGWLGDGSE